MSAVLVGLAVLAVMPGGRRWPAATATALFVLAPIPTGLAGAAGAVAVRAHRLAAARRFDATVAAEAIMLAELIALGLTAGHTFPAAMAAAQPHLDVVMQAEVDAVLRSSRRHGLTRALMEGQGHARPLYVAAARAVATGAPLAAAVALHVREARADVHAARLARARRLPVRMMLPLALLMLPGFVLVAIGPAVISAFERIPS